MTRRLRSGVGSTSATPSEATSASEASARESTDRPELAAGGVEEERAMTPGRTAYEAYRAYVELHKSEIVDPSHPRYAGWLDHTPWGIVDPVLQAAWEEAATAVLAAA